MHTVSLVQSPTALKNSSKVTPDAGVNNRIAVSVNYYCRDKEVALP